MTRNDDLRPTSNDQRPTSNEQRPTSNEQRPTSNEQRPTSSDQRPTSSDQRRLTASERRRTPGTGVRPTEKQRCCIQRKRRPSSAHPNSRATRDSGARSLTTLRFSVKRNEAVAWEERARTTISQKSPSPAAAERRGRRRRWPRSAAVAWGRPRRSSGRSRTPGRRRRRPARAAAPPSARVRWGCC
jgi:hypothetical protein